MSYTRRLVVNSLLERIRPYYIPATMWTVFLVFVIYTLFQTRFLLLLPVVAKFQQPVAESAALINFQPSSTLNTSTSDVPLANPSSLGDTSGTLTVSPAAQSTQTIDPSIVQDIESIQIRRINSIIGALSPPSFISSWWVPQS